MWHVFFLTKDKLVYKKTVKEFSPQITISAWGIIRGMKKYYIKIEIIWDSVN